MNPVHVKKTHFNKNKKLRSINQIANSRHSNLNIKTVESGVLTKAQYESFRRTLAKDLKGTVKIWFPPISCIPITRKTSGHRMGKGVGSFNNLVFPIYKGSTIVEVTSFKEISPNIIRTFSIAVKKLPIKTEFIEVVSKNSSLCKAK